MHVLAPVVAGTFYPSDRAALTQAVDRLLAKAPDIGAPPPKAVILPHAGYRFSGGPAASAAASLKPGPERVVILGPSHHHAFAGIAVPDADRVATPLGEIDLDDEVIATLLEHPDVNRVPEAFAAEHSIEVELPFLQRRLRAFKLVPLVVGDIASDRLARILDEIWGGDETMLVISTDMTHFLTAGEAERIDLETAISIEAADGARIGPRRACGYRPLAAFLTCADQRGMRLTRTALTHSGAVTGDTDRVVGYGAWLAHPPETAQLSAEHRKQALRLARQAATSFARRGRAPKINLASFPTPFQGLGAAFVTLSHRGRLRGCIGSLKAHRPLAEDILENAVRAAFKDPRFSPVTEAELRECEIEVAILSRPAPMVFRDQQDLLGQLRPGRDGLILADGPNRGTFLPKVWDSLTTEDAFLSGLKVKAGLSRDHWSPDLKIWRYMTEAFKESP